MINFQPYRSSDFIKTSMLMFAISVTLFLGACDNAQKVTDESTLGSNDAAIANDDKIERNSMEAVAEAKAEQSDDQVVIIEAEK